MVSLLSLYIPLSARAGATATTIVDALLAERASVQAPAVGEGGGEVAGDSSDTSLGAGAILRAIGQDPFRAMATKVTAADLSTFEGAMGAIVAGFNNKSVLSIRLLCEG